jgi:DNA-binding LacI/PurR family transcriptional regulator
MGAPEPRRHITLRDIARLAGVSPATVSRSLRDDHQISEATRVRVSEIADRLGYVPDAAARSLAIRASRAFGLLVPDSTDPLHGQVVAGFERAADEAGYAVIVADGLGRASREGRAIREFVAHRADGIAAWGSVLDPDSVLAMAGPSPVVMVSSERLTPDGVPPDPPTGALRTDEQDGIRQVIEHLVGGGRRRIGYVGAPRGGSNHVRREAVRDEVAARLGSPAVMLPEWAPGEQAMISERVVEGDLDAVVCYDDRVALHLLDGLRSLGVAVPGGVAVTGFDDIAFAAISNPRLTTIAQPAFDMGGLAVAWLLAAIGGAGLPASTRLPVRLVVRESSGGSA